MTTPSPKTDRLVELLRARGGVILDDRRKVAEWCAQVVDEAERTNPDAGHASVAAAIRAMPLNDDAHWAAAEQQAERDMDR